LIFEKRDEVFHCHNKIDKNVGLSIHVISKLVDFLGGSFKDIKKGEDDKVFIGFSLPFNAIKNSQMIVKTPKIHLATKKKTISKGRIILESPNPDFQRTIKRMDNEYHSQKDTMGLPQIDERNSENLSNNGGKQKGAEVRNVRAAIMNFEDIPSKGVLGRELKEDSSEVSMGSSPNAAVNNPRKKDLLEPKPILLKNNRVSEELPKKEDFHYGDGDSPNRDKKQQTLNSLQKHSSAEVEGNEFDRNLIDDSPNPFVNNADFELKINKNKKLRHPQVDKIRRQLIREAPKRSTSRS